MYILKVFDKSYHPGLIFIMKTLEICENILDLTESYLTDRRHYVVINDKMSDATGLETSISRVKFRTIDWIRQ